MSKLYLEVTGTGPDLALIHGWALNLRVWDGLVQALSGHFRLLALDLPGHGRSPWNTSHGTPAEQAWAIQETLASVSERYALLGWSLGGHIALDLAAAMPGRIERLILVGTTPRFTAAPDWPHGKPPEMLARMAVQLRTDYRRMVRDFLDLQVRGSVCADSVLEKLRQALFVHGEAQPQALETGLNILATSDLRPALPHVRVPALSISGQYDRITPPSASRAMAEAIPDARYVEIRRAAHAPFLSHGKEFAELLQEFLRPETPEGGPKSAAGKKAKRTKLKVVRP
jgi:pimeloyl-[acyl-carrier protein] methyl ester esterase